MMINKDLRTNPAPHAGTGGPPEKGLISPSQCVPATGTVQGFTLLEMMIAVMIFAVISTVSYTSLIRFFDQSQKIEAAHNRLEQIQRLFSLLEQDIRYLVARPVQYNNTTYAAMEVYTNRPVFTGEKMQFTTSRPTPLNRMAQTNYRVSWRLNDNAVYRYSWKELDIKDRVLGDKDPELQHIQRVASEIESFEISVQLNDGNDETSAFNEQAFTNDFDENLYLLPRSVKISVKTQNGRDYHRVLEVSGVQQKT